MTQALVDAPEQPATVEPTPASVKPKQTHIVQVIWPTPGRGEMRDAEVRMVSRAEKERLEPGSTTALRQPMPVREEWMRDEYYENLVEEWQRRQVPEDHLFPVMRFLGMTAMEPGFYVARGEDVQYRALLRPTGGSIWEAAKGVRFSSVYRTLDEAKASIEARE